MLCRLALVLSLSYLVIVATAAPLSRPEASRTKTDVRWMAGQLVVKLNNINIPSLLTTMSPSGEKYGAPSLVVTLRGYNNLISDSLNGAAQVKAEMASLLGRVDQWRQQNCSNQPLPRPPRVLEELRAQKRFTIGITYRVLYYVREYLKNLLENLDQLETCT